MDHFIRRLLITIGCFLAFGAIGAYAVLLLVSALNWILLSVIFFAVILAGFWIWYKGVKYHHDKLKQHE